MILLGTQLLAKGHHFPNVTLVGILDADSGLFSADFRGSERVAQLMTQVSGRAGREEKPGQVIIQSYCPDHPQIEEIINGTYQTFAQRLLEERKVIRLSICFTKSISFLKNHQWPIILKNQIELLEHDSFSSYCN